MVQNIIIYAGFSGITVLIGGLLANYFNHHIRKNPIRFEITHSMMSFGAGIILSAVALVLIPKGMETLSLSTMIISFLTGSIVFMLIEQYLGKKGGKVATLLAMLMDFVPESIALGAIFTSDSSTAMLLAIFIGLQNLPEAFNSFRDLVLSGFSVTRTLIIFTFLSFFGIGGALIGYFFLEENTTLTALLMTFASGGILYLLIQDIIPGSVLKKNYLTSLGAALGFLIGMIGEKLI